LLLSPAHTSPSAQSPLHPHTLPTFNNLPLRTIIKRIRVRSVRRVERIRIIRHIVVVGVDLVTRNVVESAMASVHVGRSLEEWHGGRVKGKGQDKA
jgi:hypothetical protein